MKRLDGVDIARGIALLTIIVNHVSYTSFRPAAVALQDYHAILFMLLAGIVFTYAHGKHHVLKNVVRGVVCIVLGLAIGAGNPNIDVILINYGFLFLISAFFIPRLSTRSILISSVVVAIVAPILSFGLRTATGTYVGPNIGFPTFASKPWLVVMNPLFYSHYPIFQWSAVFLFGAYLGRSKITPLVDDARVRLRMLSAALGMFVAAKAMSVTMLAVLTGDPLLKVIADSFTLGSGNVPTDQPAQLFASASYSGTTLALVASTSMALVVVLLCTMLARYVQWGLLKKMGMATLTLYSLHAFVQTCVPVDWINANGLIYYFGTVILLAGFALAWHRTVVERTVVKSPGPVEALTHMVIQMEQKKREEAQLSR